jgi:hypothetical protein
VTVTDWQRLSREIDGALASLPGDFAVGSLDQARLVAGPAGAFVIIGYPGADPSPEAAVATINRLAADMRAALADQLSWVPFVDTLLVTSTDLEHVGGGAAVVPIDLLHDTVYEGRAVVDERALAVIRDLLRRGQLGGWRVGLVPVGERIDLCEPQTTTTPQATSG